MSESELIRIELGFRAWVYFIAENVRPMALDGEPIPVVEVF